jgi:hypothetical protein
MLRRIWLRCEERVGEKILCMMCYDLGIWHLYRRKLETIERASVCFLFYGMGIDMSYVYDMILFGS